MTRLLFGLPLAMLAAGQVLAQNPSSLSALRNGPPSLGSSARGDVAIQDPAAGARIDFGTTPDDFGGSLGPFPGPPGLPLATQFQQGHTIVFGAAVDKNVPATSLVSDAACVDPDRSAGVPEYATDWWCQFIDRAGVRHGVPTFSASVCFIDSPVGTNLLEGYDNDCNVIASVANSIIGQEVLTLVAPPGALIAYVRMRSAIDPAGLTIDCLDFPDPVPRFQVCGRIDFGKTPDDGGGSLGPFPPPPSPLPLDFQFIGGHKIVFGAAVDKPVPATVLVADAACPDPDRSSGVPEYAADWWCQFIDAAGARHGVPVFTAEVGFIDAPVGTVEMIAYDNACNVIDIAPTTQNGHELLTVVAPAGTLIAYVQVVSSANAAGLSVDCLTFPDPVPRTSCGFVYCDQNARNCADIGISGCSCSAGSILVCMSNACVNDGNFTYLLIGDSNNVVTNPPGANGDLCVVGGCLGRYILDAGVIAGGGFCTDILNAASGGGGGNIPGCGGNLCNPPGQTWNFQYWHRDGMNPSRFSKALRATFN